MILTIVVVTYNSRRSIIPCLSALLSDPVASAGEVIVVDNSSQDDTVETVRDRFPTVTVHQEPSNCGFARACNRGASNAGGDFVLFLNPDTVIQDAAVSNLVAYAQSHAEGGIYGGRTIRPTGAVGLESCWGTPTLWSAFCFATGFSTAFPRSRFDPESLGRWDRDTPADVGVVTGLMLLIRRSLWTALGGFDDQFFMYSEDVDLCLRATALGYRPCITPTAVVIHEGGASSASPSDKIVLVLAGRATLMRKHWSPARYRIGVHFLIAGVALRAIAQPRVWRPAWQCRAMWSAGYSRTGDVGALGPAGCTCGALDG